MTSFFSILFAPSRPTLNYWGGSVSLILAQRVPVQVIQKPPLGRSSRQTHDGNSHASVVARKIRPLERRVCEANEITCLEDQGPQDWDNAPLADGICTNSTLHSS